MWRFMLLTFAFLGWSFYQLSGGSDYAPSDNSIQARAGSDDAQAPRVDVARLDADGEIEHDGAVVTRAVASLNQLDLTDGNRFKITLASADATADIQTDVRRDVARTETVAESIQAALTEAGATEVVADTAEADQQVPDSVKTGFIGEEVFSLETYVMRQDSGYTPTTQASLSGSSAGGDIREVTGNSVNMRAGPGTDYEKVGRLTKGAQIAVLEEPGNGWVMLEVVSTGETGWMADWLLTASN